jgi:hypothetical protein
VGGAALRRTAAHAAALSIGLSSANRRGASLMAAAMSGAAPAGGFSGGDAEEEGSEAAADPYKVLGIEAGADGEAARMAMNRKKLLYKGQADAAKLVGPPPVPSCPSELSSIFGG